MEKAKKKNPRKKESFLSRHGAVVFTVCFLLLLCISVIVVSKRRSLNDFRGRASGGRSYEAVCNGANGSTMTALTAFAIAQSSTCAQKGYLVGAPVCNANTGTWWMDLDMTPANYNPLCNPACVISVANRTAEINYRCTGGGTARDSAACKRTGCNNSVCVAKSAPFADQPSCPSDPSAVCKKHFANCIQQSGTTCGFSFTNQYAPCMTKEACHWCGNQCAPASTTTCNKSIPATNLTCVWKNNACRAEVASCSWCDGTCKRLTSTGSCSTTNGPSGLSCSPVKGTNGCMMVTGPVFTPTPTVTPTVTVTPTATTTPNPRSVCDASCEHDDDCSSGLSCFTLTAGVKRCRKTECLTDSTCCRYPSVTPTVTQKPGTGGARVRYIVLPNGDSPTPTDTPTDTPEPTVSPQTPTPTPVGSMQALRSTSLESNKTGLANSFTIYGVAPAFATITISISPDGIKGEVLAGADGSWSYTIPQKLTSGNKVITITAVTQDGQTSQVSYEVTVGNVQKSFMPLILVGVLAGGVAVGAYLLLRKK